MTRADRAIFLLLAGTAWAYVIARAMLVPPVHDEVRTFHMFVLTGDFVPFVAEWDAANHLLLTALAQLSYFLFGDDPFGLRIWSVLACVLYCVYAWRIGEWVGSRMVRWCLWAALLLTPFQIEFFALFRGYALGLGFMMMALFHVVMFARSGHLADQVRALSAMILAGSAMLSLLVPMCVVFALVLYFIFRRKEEAGHRTRLVWWCAMGLPLLVLVLFAQGLSHRGLLYYGSEEGLFEGTFRSLGLMVLGSGQVLWMIPVLVALVPGCWAGLKVLLSGVVDERRLGVFVVVVVFLGSLVGQELLGLVLRMRYPLDRSALYLVPLALLVFAFGVDTLERFHRYVPVIALALLYLPYRTARLSNIDHTLYWPEQSVPDDFFPLMDARQRTSDHTLLIHGGVYQVETWNFGSHRSGYRLNALDPSALPHEWFDLILIDTTTFPLPDGFRSLATGSGGHISLCENMTPPRSRAVLERRFSRPASDQGFMLILDTAAGPLKGRSIILEAEGRIISERGTLGAWIFAKVEDSAGQHLFYRAYEVDHQRGSSLDGPFLFASRIPVDSTAVRVTLGLQNARGRTIALDSIRVRMREILP